MPTCTRLRPFALPASVALALAFPLAGCVRNPEAEARAAQQFLEIGDALNELRQSTAALNTTVDSLRIVIAKQDTTIARLANQPGVAVVR